MSCTASAYIQSLHDDHWKMNIHKLHCKTPYPHEKYQITFYAAIKGWTDESLIPVEKLSSKGDIDIQNASYTVHCFRGSGTYYGEIESIDSEGIKNGDEKIFYRQWTKCDR